MNRIGWEPIWSSGRIPDRYASFAAPNESVVDWAKSLPAGAHVLDLGCGVGRHAIYLGGCGFRMAGADISPAGVERTYAVCAERGIAFDGRVCDMTALPWPDATFDAVLCISTIHHALRANIQRAIDEVWRLLTPGSLFLVDFPCTDRADYAYLRAEVTGHGPGYAHLRAEAAAGRVIEVEPNTFVDDRPDSEDSDGFLPHHFSDEDDVRDLLRRFTIEQLLPELVAGARGKWVAWARR